MAETSLQTQPEHKSMNWSSDVQVLQCSAWKPGYPVLGWGHFVCRAGEDQQAKGSRHKHLSFWPGLAHYCVPCRQREEYSSQSLPLANGGSCHAPLLQLSDSVRHQEMVSVPKRDVSISKGNRMGGRYSTAQTPVSGVWTSTWNYPLCTRPLSMWITNANFYTGVCSVEWSQSSHPFCRLSLK